MIQNNCNPVLQIQEDTVCQNGAEKIHVAVEKSFKKTMSSIRWCFRNQRGSQLCLLCIYQPSPFIPTILGNLPASKANPEVRAAHRLIEREKTKKLMEKYVLFSRSAKMEASFIIKTSDDYYEGIRNFVREHKVSKLVMWVAADSCIKMKSSHIPLGVPPFCQIMFINRGRLIWTKEATHNTDISATEAINLSGLNSTEDEDELACASFIETEVAAEVLREKAHDGLLRVQDLKSLIFEAVNKVKLVESDYEQVAGRKKEAIEALNSSVEEHERLLEEKDEMETELQKTNVKIRESKIKLQEARGRHDVATKKLMEVQIRNSSLQEEAQAFERQNLGINQWLENWRKNAKSNPETFLDEIQVPEFTHADLQTATCDFSDDFRIGRDELGCTFKGEMLGRTVIIKKLHDDSVHSPVIFQDQVRILGRLRHPHLATLLGFCSAAPAIVYEYVPGCTLHDLLKRTDPVPWSTSTQIIAQIASSLLYLHSFAVHGDLRPANIVLDKEFRCKVYGHGVCNLEDDCVFGGPSFRRTDSQDAFPYTAPELRRTKVSTTKSDLYSLGVIILQLLTKRSAPVVVQDVRKAVSSATLSLVLDDSAGEWPGFVARRLTDLALQSCEFNGENRPELTSRLIKELDRLSLAELRAVPPYFVCPITKEIMYEPMIAGDGQTYEGDAIRKWFQMRHNTSPLTNLPLEHLHLTPNHTVRLAIQIWFYGQNNN